MTTTFVGKAGVDTFRAIVIKNGLKMYATTGMRPSRMYTPSAMLKAAEQITGQKFKRGQYLQAADAIDAWLAVNGTNGHE